MMRRMDALVAAQRCFERAFELQLNSVNPELNKAYALRAQALADAGRGYVELAKEIREGG